MRAASPLSVDYHNYTVIDNLLVSTRWARYQETDYLQIEQYWTLQEYVCVLVDYILCASARTAGTNADLYIPTNMHM